MKIVYCTYDIDEMPIALRNKILEGTTVEKIYHSQVRACYTCYAAEWKGLPY